MYYPLIAAILFLIAFIIECFIVVFLPVITANNFCLIAITGIISMALFGYFIFKKIK